MASPASVYLLLFVLVTLWSLMPNVVILRETDAILIPNIPLNSIVCIADGLPHSDHEMYVCQKKSIDGGKTWGNLTYPFGRNIATREPSPVYDFNSDKLMLVGNLMDSQLIMVCICFR